MSRDLVSCDIKIPKWEEMVRGQLSRIQIAIASDVQFNIAQRFDNQGAFNGHERWKDLKTGLNMKKAGNGLMTRQVLKKSGALKNSIAPESADGQAGPEGYVQFSGGLKDSTVKVGTRLKYAAIHNYGGTIHFPGTHDGFGKAHYEQIERRTRIKGGALMLKKSFMKVGGRDIRPHGIPIPMRNFTSWNSNDQDNLQKTLKNTIEEILNGR